MNCNDLKTGQTLVCERCGLELKVINECTSDSCAMGCAGDMDCCGEPMKLKEWTIKQTQEVKLKINSTINRIKDNKEDKLLW